LTIDNLAKEYKLLPSEVIARATTFDLYVLDLGTRHLRYKQEIAEGRIAETKLSQADLKAMITRVRGE
jgi:hypothetical protein